MATVLNRPDASAAPSPIQAKYAVHVYGPSLQAHKEGRREPCVVVRLRHEPERVRLCWQARILGDSTLVYRPDAPLPGGAIAWVETDGPVVMELDHEEMVLR